MKTMLRFLQVACAAIFCATLSRAANTDTNPPPRLTVELRDGSRVVGDSVDKYFKFHSALLGEIKLAVTDIRSVECVSTNTTKLTTVNGDSLTVSFVDSEFAIKTSFGTVALQANLVRKFFVSVGGKREHPPGLVALWSGEGNGNDSVGGNNAILTDITFAEGKVGQAFSFNGTSSYIQIPANGSLNVGQGNGFTLTAWIKPSDVNRQQPILEWNSGGGNSSQLGVHFYISQDAGPGSLYAEIPAINTSWHQIFSHVASVKANEFQFVALTYDKTSGLAKVYYNGTVVTQQGVGSFTPQTSFDLYLGKRPSDEGFIYGGLMDEIAIYNRALSVQEIQNICKEENNGEMPPPSVQPRVPFNGMYRSGPLP